MIKLTIDGKDYKHPSKLEEVTLQQWIDLKSVQPDEEETSLKSDIRAFSAFTKVPQKALRKIPKKELVYYMQQVIDRISEVNTHILDTEPIKSFKQGNTTYHIEQDLDDADLGQYIDCTHLMNKIDSEEQFLPYMMAIYCLKKGEEYNSKGYDLEKRADIMRKTRAMDALNIHAFFLTTSQDYAKDTLRYLEGKPVASRPKHEQTT